MSVRCVLVLLLEARERGMNLVRCIMCAHVRLVCLICAHVRLVSVSYMCMCASCSCAWMKLVRCVVCLCVCARVRVVRACG